MQLNRLLSLPRVYSAFANLVAGDGREAYAREYIRAREGDRILDIGCGPGDILAYLPSNVGYTGFDADSAYIQAARSRFGTRGQFFCQQINPELLKQFSEFDLVLANGVLHHLDDRDAKTLFAIARTALKPHGRLITLDGCYVEHQSAVRRYLLKRDRGRFVRDQMGYTALAREAFPVVKAHIRQNLMRIPYTHIILECSA